MKKTFIFFKRSLENGIFVFIFLMGIESFTFKGPYFIILGTMLILLSLLFLTYLNKFLMRFEIKLTKWQRIFIGITIFLIAAYSVKVTETNYLKCIMPIILMITTFLLTLIYSKRKGQKFINKKGK